MRKPLLATVILLFSCSIYAQQLPIDSLLNELSKAKEDTNKVILYRIICGTLRLSEPNRAVEYGKAGALLGRKLGFDKGTAGCYLNVSASYSAALELDSSILYIDSAIIWSHKAGDPNRLALAYLNRADLHMQARNLKQSLLDCDTALQFAEQANNDDRRARVIQTIGSVYYIQEKYPQSQEYYSKALDLYRKINNKQMSAIVLNNLGNVFKHQQKYGEAIENFRRAIIIGDSIGDKNNMAMYYGNLSEVYVESGDYNQALQMATKSLEFASIQKNIRQQGMSQIYLAHAYLKQKNFPEAIKSASLAYKISSDEKDKEEQQRAADLLAEAYAKTGDHKNAYQYMVISKALNDTLVKQKYDDDIAALQTAFKLDEKNKEILLLNKDRELQNQQLSKQRTLMVGSVLVVILLLGGIALLVSRYRLRQRMKELQIRNQIAADLHDEVGSSLSSIHMLSQMATPVNSNTHHEAILEKVSSYTRETMDRMGDIVWMIKPDVNEGQGLKERMKRFLYEICGSKGIECKLEADNLESRKLTMQQRKALYLVFKEAVNNSVKYSGASLIKVTLSDQNNQLKLVVNDNGSGFDITNSSRGNGLDNMKNRAEELAGKLKISTTINAGTEVILIIPLD